MPWPATLRAGPWATQRGHHPGRRGGFGAAVPGQPGTLEPAPDEPPRPSVPHAAPLRDKVDTCPTGRIILPFRPRGSGATPAYCRCGGTGCAHRPVRSRQLSMPRGFSPKTAAAPSPSGTTPRSMRHCWWPRRPPRNGRCSASASSTPRPTAASPACTPHRTNGIPGSPGRRPPRGGLRRGRRRGRAVPPGGDGLRLRRTLAWRGIAGTKPDTKRSRSRL